MDLKKLLNQAEKDKDTYGDIHVLRFYSSLVTVSKGKVLRVTKPYLKYCPLAGHLYGEIRRLKDFDTEVIQKKIKGIVESKISQFGFFTENRELSRDSIAIPYGASEILMYAMRKSIIDAAVIVCDGAGTVIVDKPEVVQGIGARMNGLFFTSPIGRIKERLKGAGCEILFPDASIDQVKGTERAAKLGHKNIGVTINALMDEKFEELKRIEEKYNVSITVLTICTTGVTEEKIQEIEEHSDLVWSCASEGVREIIGKKSIMQLSRKIPVFVLTQKGLDITGGYTSGKGLMKSLDTQKQYIIDSSRKGKKMNVGCFEAYLREEKLPVRTKKEPQLFKSETIKVTENKKI